MTDVLKVIGNGLLGLVGMVIGVASIPLTLFIMCSPFILAYLILTVLW